MIHYYIWKNSNPELEDTLRRVNEERSAAFYAALVSLWKGAVAGLSAVSRLVERAQQRARERAAIHELSALSDRTLSDIGVPRGEIHGIARALSEGVVEPRPVAALRKQALFAHHDAVLGVTKRPAWLSGVVEGGRSGTTSPVHRRPANPLLEKAEASCG